MTQSGNVTGGGSLTKLGSGILILSNTDNYTGGTAIKAGTLRVTGSITGLVNVVTIGATFDVENTFSIGNLAGVAGSLATLGSGFTLTSNTTPSSTFAGSISGLGALAVTGTGVLTLSGANSYSGGTTVNGGTLKVTGTLNSTSPVVVNGGLFDVENTFTIGDLSGTGGLVNLGSADTLTVTTTTADSYAGVIEGPGALIVTGGTGSLTVSGTNTYTGGTTIDGGTYEVTGSITGPVDVNASPELNSMWRIPSRSAIHSGCGQHRQHRPCRYSHCDDFDDRFCRRRHSGSRRVDRDGDRSSRPERDEYLCGRHHDRRRNFTRDRPGHSHRDMSL